MFGWLLQRPSWFFTDVFACTKPSAGSASKVAIYSMYHAFTDRHLSLSKETAALMLY